MRIEEIALRQEIRQMLSEAGINKKSLYDMANEVLREEIKKQVKNAIQHSNIDGMIHSSINSYEMEQMVKNIVRKEVSDAIHISVELTATVKEKDRTSKKEA